MDSLKNLNEIKNLIVKKEKIEKELLRQKRLFFEKRGSFVLDNYLIAVDEKDEKSLLMSVVINDGVNQTIGLTVVISHYEDDDLKNNFYIILSEDEDDLNQILSDEALNGINVSDLYLYEKSNYKNFEDFLNLEMEKHILSFFKIKKTTAQKLKNESLKIINNVLNDLNCDYNFNVEINTNKNTILKIFKEDERLNNKRKLNKSLMQKTNELATNNKNNLNKI